MTSLRKAAAGLVFGAGLLGSQLYAQTSSVRALNSTKTVVDAAALSQLTTPEMQAKATLLVGQMTDQVQHATQVQATARAAKDSLKLTCVNHGLVVSTQLLNVSEDNVKSLEAAVRIGDDGLQRSHFKRVAEAAAECDKATQGIDGCIAAKDVALAGNPSGAPVNSVKYTGPKIIDNPTSHCNNLGSWNCTSQPLEYVAFASPFTPN